MASDAASSLSRNLVIVNKRGLHARASARFVETASAFNAEIEVEKDGLTVGGTSIMGLMMLAASPGCSIAIRGSGPDALAALDALEKLVETGFGEDS